VAVDSTVEDLRGALRAANDGRGVDVVLEMTGGRLFDQSLAALAPLGRLATFGMASRSAPKPVEPGQLMARSTAVIGFWLAHLVQRPALLGQAVNDLLAMIDAGELRPVIGGRYRLEDVADAHRALRERTSTGKLVIGLDQ
jgi:NADPH2:quinone reductase